MSFSCQHKIWHLRKLCFALILLPQLLMAETKKPNWKQQHAITSLSRDITFIEDSILSGYNHLIFAHKKPFAIRDNYAGTVSIWSRDTGYRQDSLWKLKDIEDMRISQDDKVLALITRDSAERGFLVHIFDLESLRLLHQSQIGTFWDLTFSPDHSYYFILEPDNKIAMRNTATGELVQNFVIPRYDEKHLYYTEIKRILISAAQPKQLLLFDIGPAEALSQIKKGIHINLYPFNYDSQSFAAPINLYFNGNSQEHPPRKFAALAVSADGRYVFMGLRGKLLTYDLVEKQRISQPIVGEPTYLRCAASNRYLIVGNKNTASLWEITPQVPKRSLRLLRRLLTKTKNLYFYDEERYLVGNSIDGNRLSFFNAQPLLSIREQPSIFVQYAAQKHTKLNLEIWFKNMRKKAKNGKLALSLENAAEENYVQQLFQRNFQYYARELFNIASDYLYTPDTEGKSSSLLYLYTDGFAPIEIKTAEQDFRRMQEAFLKGWYKWGKMEFGCTPEQLYIKQAQATINSYPYDYDEDKNTLQLTDKLSLKFQNFDLNSEKLN